MNLEECKEALFKHANIKPIITSTVWKELQKENKEFFDAYSRSQNEGGSKTQKRQKLLDMVSASKDFQNDKFRVQTEQR
ncbi:Conserved hypothetical protein CHP01589 [Vigna unguiculata]|uniref:Uncharacterized protein n=2 Tax=Vigna unguiculata TaxID=3917 RepID=A0A4D6N3G4_VIGUN|nr:Conserved hypothetical protein CHP01589 [Vigna unguiculata]